MSVLEIPNVPDAPYLDQAEPDAGDFRILADERYGTLTGGSVVAQATPAMSVHVDAGVGLVNGQIVVWSAGDLGVNPAQADPRFDLVGVDSTGVLKAFTGQASTNPRFPVWPTGVLVLASVYVPNGTTAITLARIRYKARRLTPAFRRQSSAGTDTLVAGRIDGDVVDRIHMDHAGTLTWASDASLRRSAAGVLETQGTLRSITTSAARPAQVARGTTNQTANLLQVEDGGAAVLAGVDAQGRSFGRNLIVGTGNPEGAITARISTLFQRLDGGGAVPMLYCKYEGDNTNAGWRAVDLVPPVPPPSPMPVGTISMFAGTTAPNGFLLCSGALVSSSDYPELFAVIGNRYGGTVPDFRLPSLISRMPIGGGSVGGLTQRTVGQVGGAETVALLANHNGVHRHSGGDHVHQVSPHSHGGFTAPGGYADLDINDAQHRHDPAYGPGTWSDANPPWCVRVLPPFDGPGGPGTSTHAVLGNRIFGPGEPDFQPITFAGMYHSVSNTQVTDALDHIHGIRPENSLYTQNPNGAYNTADSGAGDPHDNMPPFLVVNFIIRAVPA